MEKEEGLIGERWRGGENIHNDNEELCVWRLDCGSGKSKMVDFPLFFLHSFD